MQSQSLISWWQGIRNSYAQLFFSLSPWVGWGSIIASFASPWLGLWGLASVLAANALATLAGQDRQAIKEGMFGFNALLLGLALAYRYNPNPTLAVVWLSAMVLLVLLTVWMGKRLALSGLPALTLPFVGSMWVVVLASDRLPGLELAHHFAAGRSEYSLFGLGMPSILDESEHFGLPLFWSSYFKVLSATFFQPKVATGILLFIALLIHSRIQVLLTLLGFSMAFLSFRFLGAETDSLVYQLAGPNFFFLAIAVGGFYLIPSTASCLTVVALTPVLALIHLALMPVLLRFGLAPYTLSFNLLTILLLFLLKQRSVWQPWLELTGIQYYSPEKALYKHQAGIRWRRESRYARFRLPIWGTWKISQGYDGQHTHLKEWGKALDFVVCDEQGRHFCGQGDQPEDFYGYGKPVVAPLEGYIHRIDNHVYDNEEIGDVDTDRNWGNCVVINHNNGLYSLLAHLKKDSIQVVVGQWVEKGTLIGSCGNSGRSPEPHLHFQIQTTPEVGAKTHAYPMAYFMEYKDGKEQLRCFEVPQEDCLVANIEPNGVLAAALRFKPGMRLKWTRSDTAAQAAAVEWRCATDAYNQTYLECMDTGDLMWFSHDGVMFQAFDYEGKRSSLLYRFYLATYRIFMGEQKGVTIHELIPPIDYGNRFILAIHDLFAPFFSFYSINYRSSFGSLSGAESQDPDIRVIESAVDSNFLNLRGEASNSRFIIGPTGINEWSMSGSDGFVASYNCRILG
ncbi:MAG: urea transporter [Bacteroidota bacterium]